MIVQLPTHCKTFYRTCFRCIYSKFRQETSVACGRIFLPYYGIKLNATRRVASEDGSIANIFLAALGFQPRARLSMVRCLTRGKLYLLPLPVKIKSCPLKWLTMGLKQINRSIRLTVPLRKLSNLMLLF